MTFSSTPGGKLSKAFRFDKEHNVLKMSNDPFMDGPTLEDVSHSDLPSSVPSLTTFLFFFFTESLFLLSAYPPALPSHFVTTHPIAIITKIASLYPLRMCKQSLIP